jgi:hypothetical protein
MTIFSLYKIADPGGEFTKGLILAAQKNGPQQEFGVIATVLVPYRPCIAPTGWGNDASVVGCPNIAGVGRDSP